MQAKCCATYIKNEILTMGNGSFYILIFVFFMSLGSCKSDVSIDIKKIDSERIIAAANEYLKMKPVTVTAYFCERSEGGLHDFYSEGDYWWPNPENPDGPYIRKDGITNPNNFVAHRVAMRNMSVWVPALVAAYELTGELKYADWALKHLKAWFVDERTMMNPSLLYAQAIKGRVSGRGIGIIDTIHLIEVTKSIQRLLTSGYLSSSDFHALTHWFDAYSIWLTMHPYGIAERDHGNNHSAWWVAQVAAFSDLTGNLKNLDFCRSFFKETILPEQMDKDGRFEDELTRTKPYSYSLFNLEAFALIAELLSTEDDDLWNFETPDGKCVRKGLEFMYPFIKDKSKWTYPPDIAYFDELPVRGSALLFGGLAYEQQEYLDLWASLEADSDKQEIIRTFVIRQPLLWVD